jgi:hypothetical protein
MPNFSAATSNPVNDTRPIQIVTVHTPYGVIELRSQDLQQDHLSAVGYSVLATLREQNMAEIRASLPHLKRVDWLKG